MAKSILQSEKRCFLCGSRVWLEEHHVLGGALRKLSEREGFKVWLCHYCHNEPPNGVHQNKDHRLKLQAYVQGKAMEHYGWTKNEFIERYGKSYI